MLYVDAVQLSGLIPRIWCGAQGKAEPPMLALRAHAEQQWAAELAIGRAKAYLVGSPYATDFGFASVLQAPLQVQPVAHCVHICWSCPGRAWKEACSSYLQTVSLLGKQ